MDFIKDNPIVILFAWILVTSIVLFFMMGADKAKAKANEGSGKIRRTPEARLFLFAIIGGAIGGTAGMFVFRHKTKHWYFRYGFPLIAALQVALCVFLAVR